MGLEISSTLLERLLSEAAASPAAEVCGLLYGTEVRIDAAEPCINVADDPARAFEIDPVTLFAAYRRARSGGTTVIGHYHSHPNGPPVPSPVDAANAMGDGAVWLILGGHLAQAWRTMEAGRFEALMLTRTPSPG